MTPPTDEPATTTDSTGHEEITSLTDPEAVADRSGVEIETSEYEHESPDHCELDAAGRVIVGVQNDCGELLVRSATDRPVVLQPNTVVDEGGDWAAAARETVAETAGIDVTVTDVRAVRRVDHTVTGSDADLDPTYHVLLEARPTDPLDGDGAGDSSEDESAEDDWTVEWIDELPEELRDADGDALDDIRTFL